MDDAWCKWPDVGLPRPDRVFFLDLPSEVAAKRAEFGKERYEKVEFQEKVKKNFMKLKDDNWKIVDATRPLEAIADDLFEDASRMIEEVDGKEVGRLWEDMRTQKDQ
ncbi:DTYMK [Symbiodinium sp. KB8]|nr:DTYMK [Symbiodinium sp. KB8]